MTKRIGLAVVCAIALLPAASAFGKGSINGDPYLEGCTKDAETVASLPMDFNGSEPFGELQLRKSSSCETVWGEVYFPTPNYSEAVVTITIEQSQRGFEIPPEELGLYSQPANVSPIYSDMLPDEDCITLRADVSGYYKYGSYAPGHEGISSQEVSVIKYNCTPPVTKSPPAEEKPGPKEESKKEPESKTVLPVTTPTVVEVVEVDHETVRTEVKEVSVPAAIPTQLQPKNEVGTAFHASHRAARPKPKAKPKKVCRKHGKKVACKKAKNSHRKVDEIK